jgi:hypothetical protein
MEARVVRWVGAGFHLAAVAGLLTLAVLAVQSEVRGLGQPCGASYGCDLAWLGWVFAIALAAIATTMAIGVVVWLRTARREVLFVGDGLLLAPLLVMGGIVGWAAAAILLYPLLTDKRLRVAPSAPSPQAPRITTTDRKWPPAQTEP